MEFHDVLHGHIQFSPTQGTTALISDLLGSPEINRLRNMRQMNFDVPLIQELGRSRRLPHSIGVTHLATQLAQRDGLSTETTRVLVAAAMLHDAAIPPYGHLVESEFENAGIDFRHEKRVAQLINGTVNAHNKYMALWPGKSLRVAEILSRYEVDSEQVIKAIRPHGKRTAISADIDLDNIDNVHRMAVMLGWDDAKQNMLEIIKNSSLNSIGPIVFNQGAIQHLQKWMNFRQRIYTMIIAHPECVPYNALQVDLVRAAVAARIISPDDWWLSEPEFEDAMRHHEKTQALAKQLITGCDYQLVDYAWFKDFVSPTKLNNLQIANCMLENIDIPAGFGHFVWNERKLITRRVRVSDESRREREIGENSASCMIALVKRTTGRPKWTKSSSFEWRKQTVREFANLFNVNDFQVEFPENYTGNFQNNNNELNLGYY